MPIVLLLSRNELFFLNLQLSALLDELKVVFLSSVEERFCEISRVSFTV